MPRFFGKTLSRLGCTLAQCAAVSLLASCVPITTLEVEEPEPIIVGYAPDGSPVVLLVADSEAGDVAPPHLDEDESGGGTGADGIEGGTGGEDGAVVIWPIPTSTDLLDSVLLGEFLSLVIDSHAIDVLTPSSPTGSFTHLELVCISVGIPEFVCRNRYGL